MQAVPLVDAKDLMVLAVVRTWPEPASDFSPMLSIKANVVETATVSEIQKKKNLRPWSQKGYKRIQGGIVLPISAGQSHQLVINLRMVNSVWSLTRPLSSGISFIFLFIHHHLSPCPFPFLTGLSASTSPLSLSVYLPLVHSRNHLCPSYLPTFKSCAASLPLLHY